MQSTEIAVAPGFHPGGRRQEAAARRAGTAASRGGRARLTRALVSRFRSVAAQEGGRVIEPPRRELPTPFC